MKTKGLALKRAEREILGAMCDGLVKFIGFMLRSILKFDKKVLKRYFNIETPLYKWWWKEHSASIQRKLDKRRNETLV